MRPEGLNVPSILFQLFNPAKSIQALQQNKCMLVKTEECTVSISYPGKMHEPWSYQF